MIQQSIEIGPVHSFLPGAMKLGLGLRGDEIQSVDVGLGYLSKNLLVGAKGMSVLRAQLKLSRIEPENALITDRLISESVEEATETTISDRAQWIREVVTLVSDLGAALKYLALMSKRMRLDPLTQVILRHREDLIDLVELFSGSRFGYDYVLPGGVRFDLSDGFSERLEKWIKNFERDYSRIQAMFYWVRYHESYLRKIGGVIDVGDLGFISRSHKEESRLGWVSNVKTRLDFMLASALEMGEALSHKLEESAPGDFRTQLLSKVKNRATKRELTTYRGDWIIELDLDESLKVKSVNFITPSDKTIKAVPEALVHENMDDLPLILQSLNISIAEIDK